MKMSLSLRGRLGRSVSSQMSSLGEWEVMIWHGFVSSRFFFFFFFFFLHDCYVGLW